MTSAHKSLVDAGETPGGRLGSKRALQHDGILSIPPTPPPENNNPFQPAVESKKHKTEWPTVHRGGQGHLNLVQIVTEHNSGECKSWCATVHRQSLK